MIISHSQALTAINLSHKTANAAESRATVGDGAGYHQLRRPKYFQLRGNNQFRLQVRNVSQPDSEVSKETDRNSLKSLDAQLASRATPSTKAPTNTLPPETKDPPRWTPPNAEDWPEFDGGFLVYAAGVLIVLTVVTNVVFSSVDKSLPGYIPKPARTSTKVADLQRSRDEKEIENQLRTVKRLADMKSS